MNIIVQSFGFKYGLPIDSDFVFDVRCLPNPYWKQELRGHTGQDQAVIEFLDAEAEVQAMRSDIHDFLQKWLPSFKQNRRYLTVAIGCTGGQHRSVYLCEKLHQQFLQQYASTQIRHRELAAVR